MKAARFHGPGDIRLDDIPEPVAGPGQAKVAVGWCGICGTGLHEFLGEPIFVLPAGAPRSLTGDTVPEVIGHESVGVVTDVGAGAGCVGADRIAVEPFYACGTCSVCAAGRYDVCRRLGFVGLASQAAVVFGAGPIGLVTASALRRRRRGSGNRCRATGSAEGQGRGLGRRPCAGPDRGPTCRQRRGTSPTAQARTSRSSAPVSTRRRRRGRRVLGPPGHRGDERPRAEGAERQDPGHPGPIG